MIKNYLNSFKISSVGFSMIELLIVLSISLVLMMATVPRYKFYKKNARATEAQHALTDFYRLQQNYYIENGAYGKTRDIGFDFQSKHYTIGFHDGYQPESSSAAPAPHANCTLDTINNTFIAGSANNKDLKNMTINQKNCLQESDNKCQSVGKPCI